MRAPIAGIAILIAVCAGAPLAASDFTVAAATGVVAPEGLQIGQEVAAGTHLRLEPWGRVVVRETTGCGLTLVVAGAADYPLESAEDCGEVAEPGVVLALLQQGAVFAAHVAASSVTDNLVQSIAQEPCVFMPRLSEGAEYQQICPSGYAIRAMRCIGQFCDSKDMLCCPYLAGEEDKTAKKLPWRVISEEPPNNFVQTKQGFFRGFACYGPRCDEVGVHQFRSSRLSNTGQCEWTGWTSDQPEQWLDCGAERLLSGIRCRGDFCGEIETMCCGTERKD